MSLHPGCLYCTVYFMNIFQVELTFVHSPYVSLFVTHTNFPGRTIAAASEIINLETALWAIVQKCEKFLYQCINFYHLIVKSWNGLRSLEKNT